MCIRDSLIAVAIVPLHKRADEFLELAHIYRVDWSIGLEAVIAGPRWRGLDGADHADARVMGCLLYTSDAADERSSVDLGGRRIIKKKHIANIGVQTIS